MFTWLIKESNSGMLRKYRKTAIQEFEELSTKLYNDMDNIVLEELAAQWAHTIINIEKELKARGEKFE